MPKYNEGVLIISDFRFARDLDDPGTLRAIKDNMYYIPTANYRAGNPENDLLSLALILMAQEMGIKEYEEKMKKKENRRKVMKEFTTVTFYCQALKKLITKILIGQGSEITFDALYNAASKMTPRDYNIAKQLEVSKLR